MKAERWGEVKSVLATVLETSPDQRTATLERLCNGDDDLRREVESLLALERRADAELDTEAAPGALLRGAAEAAPERIGPYRILREIGRGGMGVVYLGDRADGEYRKQVAIKLITSGRRTAANDPLGLERRFRRERQILSQFEHPGIARMLDGGATEEGQPYFVLEYVEGLPLLDYCDARRLPVSARLTLFLSICDAVAHAHRQLIVHRDLKPGNILVTPEGTPKLLDFGLARVLDADGLGDDITQAALPMMTPAYASPEQIRGEAISVSGDVYSLGVILYELLSSARPYQLSSSSIADMVRVVCEQPPVPLNRVAISEPIAAHRSSNVDKLRRSLSGDLERIAAKALEKDPRQRYASVDDLASDLRRHLTGLPVRARPATFAYRASKLLERHRVAVPAGAIAVILILAFAGVAMWEARSAQRRFDEVRSLAHSVMFDLHDAIAPLPGSTAARQMLVGNALQYLERLSQESSGDPKLAWEIALGYERIGIVQGYAPQSNLGQPRAALESLKKAAAILDRFSPATSSNKQLRQDFLRINDELVSAYDLNGDMKSAMPLVERGIEIAESSLRANPSDLSAVHTLAVEKFELGDVLTNQGNFDDAILVRQQALDLFQRLADAKPSKEAARSLALAHKKLAALLGVKHRYQESFQHYELAREIDEKRLGGNLEGPSTWLDLSYDYSDLGWVNSRLEKDPIALEWHNKALDLRKRAAAADPNDSRAAHAVASSTGRIGAVYRRMGRLDDAFRYMHDSLDAWLKIVEKSPGDIPAVTEVGDAHADLGEIESDMAGRPGTSASKKRELLQRTAQEYETGAWFFTGLRDKGRLPKQYDGRIAEYSQAAVKAREQAAKVR